MALLTYSYMDSELTRRSRQGFKTENWKIEDWALALAGEVGELCNVLKKVKRGDFLLDDARKAECCKELADIIMYAQLGIKCLGSDTGEVIRSKFEEVSKRINYK